jgi:hypothetical protein
MNKKICYRDRATAKMANWIEECLFKIENLVPGARSEFNGFAGRRALGYKV